MHFFSENVTQVLEVQLSSPGIYTLQCESDQSGYYSSKVNLTLKITEIDNNGGTIVSLFYYYRVQRKFPDRYKFFMHSV